MTELKDSRFTISIHALREEGDHGRFSHLPSQFLFLSTPSARRATRANHNRNQHHQNFYPRPPRGGRPVVRLSIPCDVLFLSTPSARRATPPILGIQYSHARFLSTPSARRATSPRFCQVLGFHNFYPRPPRGGRRIAFWSYASR